MVIKEALEHGIARTGLWIEDIWWRYRWIGVLSNAMFLIPVVFPWIWAIGLSETPNSWIWRGSGWHLTVGIGEGELPVAPWLAILSFVANMVFAVFYLTGFARMVVRRHWIWFSTLLVFPLTFWIYPVFGPAPPVAGGSEQQQG